MEMISSHNGMDNPKWIEEDLFKLPCKELKKLARKSNVNPNFKKADLVKALVNSSVPVIMEKSEFKENERSTRRMTRSRVSIYQHTDEVQDLVTEVKTLKTRKPPGININVLVDEYKGKINQKGKDESAVQNSILDTFKIVSSISTKSKPLKERTNNKTETNNGDKNDSDNSKKPLNKKSRQSEPKTNPSLRHANVEMKSSIEKVVNIQSESKCTTFDLTDSDLCINKNEESHSEDNNVLEVVKDEKVKRKGRKKKLEEQSDLSVEVKTTSSESVTDTRVLEVKSDQNEKPKGKRRLKKQNKDEEICINMKDDSKTNSDGEVIPDANCFTESEIGNRKKRRGKTSKSEVEETSQNKDISGVFTISDISSYNIQNNASSLNKQLVVKSNDKRRSSRNPKISMGENIEKNHDSALDLFAEESIGANHSENLANISGKDSNNETAMPVAVPLRSSTFVLDSPGLEKNGSGKKKSFDKPTRSNTFTVDENDDKSPKVPKRTSLRFVAGPESQQKSSPSVKPKKVEESIGKRILSAFAKKNKAESVVKSEKPTLGSSVKKTITKSTTTPAYLNKFGVVRKAPNFKNIHQKLFQNMESLGDNHKRKLERAQDLLQSPAPRCAVSVFSPRLSQDKKNKTLTTQTPKQPPAPLTKTKTPGTATGAQLNRFGFKTRINKLEANVVVGKKLPPVSMEKTKDKDRKFLQGVRTNKRFMLQMQMRQNKQ